MKSVVKQMIIVPFDYEGNVCTHAIDAEKLSSRLIETTEEKRNGFKLHNNNTYFFSQGTNFLNETKA